MKQIHKDIFPIFLTLNHGLFCFSLELIRDMQKCVYQWHRVKLLRRVIEESKKTFCLNIIRYFDDFRRITIKQTFFPCHNKHPSKILQIDDESSYRNDIANAYFIAKKSSEMHKQKHAETVHRFPAKKLFRY
jgi:hypothetical protein